VKRVSLNCPKVHGAAQGFAANTHCSAHRSHRFERCCEKIGAETVREQLLRVLRGSPRGDPGTTLLPRAAAALRRRAGASICSGKALHYPETRGKAGAWVRKHGRFQSQMGVSEVEEAVTSYQC